MSHKRFFISDTHFGHGNSLIFKRNDGSPLRDFSSVEEMDETMVERWNAKVRQVDTIYHLGDVVINRKSLPILSRLNGRKILVRGNHDIFRTKDYLPYFDEIHGVRVFNEYGFVCTHVPIHTGSLERWKANVHGHLHSNVVLKHPSETVFDGTKEGLIDSRYVCVSVEQTNYAPLELDEVMSRIEKGY